MSKEVNKEEVNKILKSYIDRGFNNFTDLEDSDEKASFILGIRLIETVLSKNKIEDITDDIDKILGNLNYAERIPALLTILDHKIDLFSEGNLKSVILKYRDDLITINEQCDD